MRLGCEAGTLNVLFPFNVIDKIELKIVFTIPEISLGVREAISKMSVGTGQGFLKCSCKTGKCLHCNCAKSNVSCNSRCHGGQSNHNCDRKK